MTDDWAIASLSQVIEEDDDDDDILIPPTPGQEDIDITNPTHDNTLLGVMVDSQAAGRRKITSLSLGLPDDPESESLPFLALEWDPQFPPTPAPENGQSAESYLFATKDRDENHSHSKTSLTNESCNGQSTVWEGCSTSWLTKDAEASGIRTMAGGSGDESSSKSKGRFSSDNSKREGKNVDDRGGGGGGGGGGASSGGGGGDGGKDGDGEDEGGPSKRRKKDPKEEEDSSHEPSSDSSEGLLNLPEGHKKEIKATRAEDVSYAGPKIIREGELNIGPTSLYGDRDIESSERDLFASQTKLPKDMEQKSDRKKESASPIQLTASNLPPLRLSQLDEQVASTSSRKSYSEMESPIPMTSPCSPSPFLGLQSTGPPKRKLTEDDDDLKSDLSFKQPRTEEGSASSESGEEKVIVEYSTLTKKDVEISPKRQRVHSEVTKPVSLSAVKRITFNPDNGSSSAKDKGFTLPYSAELSEEIELPSLSPGDTGDKFISMERMPRRLPVDTEEESSDNNEKRMEKTSVASPKDHLDTGKASDKEDSDIEIIEDEKDRSIEVLYEKSKVQKSSPEDIGSQDINLMLTGTQSDLLEEESQRFSEEPHRFVDVKEPSQSQSQSLLRMPDSEDLKCHGSLSSSSEESCKESTQDVANTMAATQVEEICIPAIVSQTHIEPLISMPLSSSLGSKGRTESAESQSLVSKDGNVEAKSPAGSQVDKDNSDRKSGSNKEKLPLEEDSESFRSPARLQMPDILTPATQDIIDTHESESIFIKAANAAKERIQREEKKLDKSSELKSDSSFECMDVSPCQAVDPDVSVESRVEITSSECTPVLGVPSFSSHLTPVSSHSRLLHSQSTTLFGSGKKDETSSPIQQNPRILCEGTDSEDEGGNIQKRKKPRTKGTPNLSMPEVVALKSLKKDTVKTSTPNTSQDVIPNLSGVGGSDIDKDHPGTTLESSKSYNSSTEHLAPSSKSPESVTHLGAGKSSQDTQVISISEDVLSVDELIKDGFKEELINIVAYRYLKPLTGESYIVIRDPELEYRHPLTNDVVSVVYECERGTVKKVGRQQIVCSETSSHFHSRSRVSDVSLLSRTSSSSGYLGDKSSSSGSSHRTSLYSTADSRLSLGSVITLPSPPRDKKERELDDRGHFIVPPSRKRPYPPKVITIDESRSPPKPSLPRKLPGAGLEYSTSTTSDERIPSPEKRRKPRARGKSKGVSGHLPTSSPPSAVSPGRGRGRGKGRGRGRGRGTPVKSHFIESNDAKEMSPESPVASTSKRYDDESIEKVAASSDIKALGSDNPELDHLLKSVPGHLWKLLENSQSSYSEEEEDTFVFEGGADEEKQLELVTKRVREVDLKPGMLVFARFTDMRFYSAILLEPEGTDRWQVRFTLDEHKTLVREVYILPTDILPRGYSCLVKHSSDQFCDPGIVKGHVRLESALLHIVETDKGIIRRVPHSHIYLNNPQAEELLRARCHFRSMVASPGRDVSLDNIVGGKRHRMPNKQISSPKTRRVDENLESSESAAGEFDDLASGSLYSPRGRKTSERGSRGKRKDNLSILQEESESEYDATYTPSTPRGRKKGGGNRGSRTPSRTPKTPKAKVKTEICESVATPEIKAQSSIVSEPTPGRSIESVPEDAPKTPLKKRGRPAKQSSGTQTPTRKLKSEEMALDPRLGPLPPENSQIFSGFEILLTSGESSLKKQSSDEVILPPFDKDHLKRQIEGGGGKVIENFAEAELILAQQGRSVVSEQTPNSKKGSPSVSVILVSRTHCRTSKFIQCLAAGIPIVSVIWVMESCAKGKPENLLSYLLPAGEDSDEEPVEQRLIMEKGIFAGPPSVLKGESVFLATSSNSDFSSLWQPILVTAGANVRVKTPKGNLSRLLVHSMTVVVADSTIPAKELERAQQLKIPVVSTEWIIQSLIAGKRLGYRDHPKFIHNARESPDPSKDDAK